MPINSLTMPLGITPARAGKTQHYGLERGIRGDHPRSCGKDMMPASTALMELGSPPLVRERPSQFLSLFITAGITPARAGKTSSAAITSRSLRDHPRSCGKDTPRSRRNSSGPGSPPLVRERLAFRQVAPAAARITPARAGKTDKMIVSVLNIRDHPRSCGKDNFTWNI